MLKSPTREDVTATKSLLAEELNTEGFAVMGYISVWHVYVIEMSDGVGTRVNPEFPWV